MKTGLHDDRGAPISVDDLVRRPTMNAEHARRIHGDWAIYRVVALSMVLRLSYVRSQNGEVLPPGYLGCLLTDVYDHKNLVLLNSLDELRPDGERENSLVVCDSDGNDSTWPSTSIA